MSRVIAQIVGIRHAKVTNDSTVYDPTCGSGSLLLKIGDEARHNGHKDVKVTLYGRKITLPLARSASVQRDLLGALACDGAATRPRVVECRTACAGAQHGQGVIAMRGTRYPCVQPAAAVGF